MARRNSMQRRLVLEAVEALGGHPTAEEIFSALKKDCPSIGRGTVYRNLNLLAREGEIGRIGVANAPDRFECKNFLHYHMRCRKCGRLFDSPLPYRKELDGGATPEEGFFIERHHILFEGLCRDCRREAAGAQEDKGGNGDGSKGVV